MMSCDPPFPHFDDLSADWFERMKQAIKHEANRSRRLVMHPDHMSDQDAFLMGLYCAATNTPIYNQPILWQTFAMRGHHIQFGTRHGYGLASADNNHLTRLVFEAHRHHVQVRVNARTKDVLQVSLSMWQPWGGDPSSWNSTHPTLSEAIRAWEEGRYVPNEPDSRKAASVDIADLPTVAMARPDGMS